MESTLRPSTTVDAAWIAEVKAQVMRPDLERLGRFDEVRVRRRFLDAFEPAFTRVIAVDGAAPPGVSTSATGSCSSRTRSM